MDNERYIFCLSSKLLNFSDELGEQKFIANEMFKKIVTGEMIIAKSIFKDPVHFKPRAVHVFGTNKLPYFKSGIDNGIQRRLMIISFNRKIPKDEKIAEISKIIIKNEYNLLFSWALEGACRLVKRKNFDIKPIMQKDFDEWMENSDSLHAFCAAKFEYKDKNEYGTENKIASSFLYKTYLNWGDNEGYRRDHLLGPKNFAQQILSIPQVTQKKINGTSFICGIELKSA